MTDFLKAFGELPEDYVVALCIIAICIVYFISGGIYRIVNTIVKNRKQ